MKTTNTHGRLLAIVAGMAFTVGGLVILMGDVLTRPNLWAQYHVLTVLTVFGVIASGHLMATAWRARHFLAALGFGVLFLAGTMLVVHNSVGRQAEVTDSRALDAEATNKALADKHGDLAKARQRFDDATRYADGEMRGEICGPRCRDWRLRAKEVQAHIKAIEAEIAALGPQKPVNAKADRMAAILALFGFDEVRAKAALILLEPFLWCLFFEIGSIVSLGFAFRADPVATVAQLPTVSDSFQTSYPPLDTDSAAVLAALKSAGKPITNDELAALMAVEKSEASKRAQNAARAGVINRVRSGKFVLHSIAL